MLATWFTAVASMVPSVVSNDVFNAVDLALRQSILSSGQTRAELEQFLQERIPACKPPATAADWERDSQALRQKLLDGVIFRGVPPAWREAPLHVEWVGAIDTGKGYRIRKLRYDAIPGLWIPALLYEPVGKSGRMPCVLNVNGHYMLEGKARTEEQLRSANLAKRGILSLHPEWLNCGELRTEGLDHNRLAYLDLCGVSGVAVFYQAMKRGLDTLLSLPNADPDKVAMTGLSGGGWQTILLSALDTRVQLTAPNAGYIGLADRTGNVCDIGDLEEVPADFIATADYVHLTALLAPRPALLLYNAQDDCCFSAQRARASVYEPVTPFYKLSNNADRFLFHTNEDPGNHNYDRDNREQFYRFYNRHFLPQADWKEDELACEGELKTLEELRVGVPDGNATFYSLADERLGSVPVNGTTRDGLKQVLRFKPLQVAEVAGVEERNDADVHAVLYRLRVGSWTVPAAVFERAGQHLAATRIIFSDRGKARMEGFVAEAFDAGARAVVIDPLLMGECNDLRDRTHQYAMMIATVGERPLGIQAAQILAVADWVRKIYGAETVSLVGHGWTAGIAALAAGAIASTPFDIVTAREVPTSLKVLIRKRLSYENCPALFHFGLLRAVDVPQLRSLCQAATVEISTNDDPPKS